MIYKIEITEILQKIITITASSEEEALILIKKKYENQNIILDDANLVETKIELYKESNN